MSFFSPTFALFFVVTVTVYYLAPGRLRIPWLLAASVLFYMSFVPEYIFFLLGLIVTDYAAAHLIETTSAPHARRVWLIVSLVANFGFMASFKYGPALLGRPFGEIPLGLSFHTFQSTAYVIDVYRGRQKAESSFLTFALYVMFFPQLAAGPIERAHDLLPQFHKQQAFEYSNIVAGLQQMAWGLFQKFVISAHFASLVNAVYLDPSSCTGPVAVFAAISFPFQLYCDFGGYSDIAIGSARVLGYDLTRNFNRPFQADSIAEYWKRWHISLSSWLRDYVFYPLCGKRPGIARISASIFLVLTLTGIWHGARWNYLISGMLHGTYRVTELLAGRAISRRGWSLPEFLERPARIIRIILVFLLVCFAMVFFRSESVGNALAVLSRFGAGWSGIHSWASFAAPFRVILIGPTRLASLIALIGLVHIVGFAQAHGSLRAWVASQPFWLRWSIYYAGAVALVALAPLESEQFIYFQF